MIPYYGAAMVHDPMFIVAYIRTSIFYLNNPPIYDENERMRFTKVHCMVEMRVEEATREGTTLRQRYVSLVLDGVLDYDERGSLATLPAKVTKRLSWVDGPHSDSGDADYLLVKDLRITLYDADMEADGGCTVVKNLIKHQCPSGTGYIFTQYASKDNQCGPTCLVKYIKAHPELGKQHNTVNKMATLLKQSGMRSYRKGMRWSGSMLNTVCVALGINLKVYNLSAFHNPEGLGDPMYEGANGGSLTVTIAWCQLPGALGGDPCGHYLLVGESTRTCPECSLIYPVRGANTRHTCKWTCDKCLRDLHCPRGSHACLVEREEEEEVKEEKEEEVAAYNVTFESEETVASRLAEVANIVAGRSADGPVIEEWGRALDGARNTLLLGDGGTGKSYTMRAKIRSMIEEAGVDPRSIAIVAAEAVGVKEYEEKLSDLDLGYIGTIHSFISLQANGSKEKLYTRIRKKEGATYERLKLVKVLVFEEIGSCPITLFKATHEVMNIVHNDAGRAFGGVSVHCTGDFRQRGQDAKVSAGTVPIFMSKLWKALRFQRFVLRENHRLSSSDPANLRFLSIQLRAARGVATQSDVDWLNEQCFEETPVPLLPADEVSLVLTNKHVHSHGLARLHANYPPSEIIDLSIEGDKTTAKYDSKCKLAIGVPVMFTTNDFIKKAGKACNGTLGVVSGVTYDVEGEGKKDTVTVRLLSSGIEVLVRRKVVGGSGPTRVKQFPIRLAYARTIHKSQGASISKCRLWVPTTRSGENQCGPALLYVALSRCRNVRDFKISGKRLPLHLIRYSTLNVHFMDLMGSDLSTEMIDQRVATIFEKAKRGVLWDTASSSQSVSRLLSVRDKSVSKKKAMKLYSREERSELKEEDLGPHYKGVFNDIVYYDFETASRARVYEGRHVPYYVHANFYSNYENVKTLSYGVDKETGELKEDCLQRFGEWLINDIVLPQCQEWEESKYKERKDPIRLIGYNASRFDMHFVMNWLLNKYELNGQFSYTMVTKGSSTMVVNQIVYTSNDGGRSKVALESWDPCLLLSASLSNAHADWCKEKHKSVEKDCFPHIWLSEDDNMDRAWGLAESSIPIEDGFPSSMWGTVRKRLRLGTLLPGELTAEGHETVRFNCTRELHRYCAVDVEMLEDVVESSAKCLWDDVLPGMNVPIFKFPTAASLSIYLCLTTMPDMYMVPQSAREQDKSGLSYNSQLFRLTKEDDNMCRSGNYGGRTINRALAYRSEDYESLWEKHTDEEEKMDCADYDAIDDCYYYIDAVGLYHHLMQSSIFPYGPETILEDPESCREFWEQYLASRDALSPKYGKLPMFFAHFPSVQPHRGDLESALPSRCAKTGRLLWDNMEKKDIVYNSVHVNLGLERGYTFSVPTKIMLWGDQVGGEWIARKGKVLNKSMAICLDLRARGGVVKVFGKLVANATFGCLAMRDFMSELFTMKSRCRDPSSQYREHIDRIADPNCWELVRETEYISRESGEPVGVLHATWNKKVTEEDYICKRVSYIGSFILAYAHELVDDAIETVMGDDRRAGVIYAQPCNGDTDSIFIHRRYLMARAGVVGLQFSEETLGAWNDDLKKYCATVPWDGRDRLDLLERGYTLVTDPDTGEHLKYIRPKGISYDAQGVPRFAKIVLGNFIAKKMYSLEFVTPDGRLLTSGVKSKGIPKGKQTMVQRVQVEEKMEDEHEVPMAGPVSEVFRSEVGGSKRKREDEGVEDTRVQRRRIRYTSTVSAADFTSTLQLKSRGLRAYFRRLQRVGAHPTAEQLVAGIRPHDIIATESSRSIVSRGAAFPPERVSIRINPLTGLLESSPSKHVPQFDDEVSRTTIWSVPRGYKDPRHPDSTICL